MVLKRLRLLVSLGAGAVIACDTFKGRAAIFLSGLPGSGKSRLIEALCEVKTADVLDLDVEIAEHPEFDLQNVPKIYSDRVAYDWADRRIEARFRERLRASTTNNIVVDGTGTNVSRLLRRIEIAKAHDLATILFYVKVDVETALRRNAKRQKRTVPIHVLHAYNDMIADAQIRVSSAVDCYFVINNNAEHEDRSKQIDALRVALAELKPIILGERTGLLSMA